MWTSTSPVWATPNHLITRLSSVQCWRWWNWMFVSISQGWAGSGEGIELVTYTFLRSPELTRKWADWQKHWVIEDRPAILFLSFSFVSDSLRYVLRARQSVVDNDITSEGLISLFSNCYAIRRESSNLHVLGLNRWRFFVVSHFYRIELLWRVSFFVFWLYSTSSFRFFDRNLVQRYERFHWMNEFLDCQISECGFRSLFEALSDASLSPSSLGLSGFFFLL